ncbi:hypothetical protein [Pseudomonas anguilliseptica]|uniref:Lipoprotein n=1 Tax=Pseudomonas anguilliseptica TaxID=53406 RepID=A0A1H4ZLU5_PSEAG|nr:hypothetical protein [Pseudomonas anguilliseptica]SED30360.1 hypothetical protein SAMN05421553_2417 [Pseudomonas anguilliseptica]
MRKSMQMGGLGLLLIGLVGCEVAEQSAQELVEKAVVDVAREAVDETVKELNKQVDEVQQSTNEWLGKPVEEAESQQSEQPQTKPDDQAASKSIET